MDASHSPEKIRVLYVDDESALLDIGKVFLEQSGDFTVTTATSAPDAIRLLEQKRFDAIISDYQMPEMDGIDFLKHLKGEGNTTPFVIFTGKGREEVVIEALNAGADGYLQKGGESKSQFAELAHKIKKAVEGRQAEDALWESEERYSSLFDNSYSVAVLIDPDTGRIIDANAAAARYYGYSRDELASMGIYDLNRLSKEKVIRNLRKAKDEKAKHFFSTHYLASGEKRNVEIYSGPIILQKKPLFYSIIHDITERKQAEAALLASEKFLNSIIENIPDMIFVKEAQELRFVRFNKAGEDLLGHSRKDLYGKNDYDLFPKDEADIFTTNDREVFRNKNLLDIPEERIQTRNKGLRILHTKKLPILDNKGNPQFLIGISEDITERKRADAALQKSEDKYRQLVEIAREGIWAIDAENNTTYLNPRMAEMLQYTVDEMQNLPLQSFMDDAGKMIFAQNMAGRRQGIAEVLPFELIKKGGDRIYATISASPLTDDTGAYQGSIAVISDITDRKRAGDALAESEERFRMLLQHIPLVSIQGYSIDGTTHYWDEASEHLYGYTASEAIGKNLIDLIIPPEMQEDVRKACKYMADSGQPIPASELALMRKDGSRVAVFSSHALFKKTGGEMELYCIDIDLTERKRAEEALRQANKQLNLLSSITRHDILNQLMALKGYLYLSHMVIDNPTTLSEYIKKEEQAANAIERQITFTRDYQELGAAVPEWQSVNASIKKAVAGLPMRDVSVEPDPADPEVYADPLFLKVFYNLIDNALRYGGDQMKTIRVSSQETDTGLTILCEDDGVGIAAEDKNRLFIRGFGKNTGFGLFLSREILAITGITITETGEPGKGARFEIAVPNGMWRMKGANN